MITNIYIDGFNLYYRALKDGPFRWLDLHKLCQGLFPKDTIHQICYFTSLLLTRPENLGQPRRQLTYLCALNILPDLKIFYGTFRSGVKHRRVAFRVTGLPASALVRNFEEKGSDVNLATRLLVDGYSGDYQQAVIISNYADFASAMEYVRDSVGLRGTLVNPYRRKSSPKNLSNIAIYI